MPRRLRSALLRAVIATGAALAMQATMAATEQAIDLATATGIVSGSLLLPDASHGADAAAKPPVVLIIAGSGPTNRDGNSLGTQVRTNNLQMLASALANAGFASVRFDKRGVGESANAGPHEIDLRFESYVDDAAAWAALLAHDKRFAGVAIVGHSEGSLIGMLAARRGDVRAFVSVAGPARDAASILRTQLAGKLPPDLAARNELILTALQAGQRVDDIPSAMASLYRANVQPYLISWFRYVPSEQMASLGVPSLIAQGDKDIQVPVSEAEALHAAQPMSMLLIVPGMTHTLKLAAPGAAGQTATYIDPTLPLAPAFVHGVVEFLSRTMLANPSAPARSRLPPTPDSTTP